MSQAKLPIDNYAVPALARKKVENLPMTPQQPALKTRGVFSFLYDQPLSVAIKSRIKMPEII